MKGNLKNVFYGFNFECSDYGKRIFKNKFKVINIFALL